MLEVNKIICGDCVECPLRHGHACGIMKGEFSCNATDEVLGGDAFPKKCPLHKGPIIICMAKSGHEIVI